MKKILFIEDEVGLQRAVGQVLREAGFEVLSALNGEDGLRLAKSDLPDLILLDLILPQKSGFGVLVELKQESATARIPVIIMSNLEGGVEVQRALELGATTYLVKVNYRLEDVVAKVKGVLGE